MVKEAYQWFSRDGKEVCCGSGWEDKRRDGKNARRNFGACLLCLLLCGEGFMGVNTGQNLSNFTVV